MTALQVDYWRFKETERTNMANEKLRADELAETTRHNQVTESETARHNRATEAIGWAQVGLAKEQLGETARHNQALESIQQFQADTDRQHWSNWSKFQEQNIAIQRDSLEIQRERNKISSIENDIRWKEYKLSETKISAEIANRTRDLDLREQEVAIAKSDVNRKWFDSIFGNAGLVSKEARGWTQNAAG